MYKNGEINLIKFLASTNLFVKKSNSIKSKQKEYFFDLGANFGKYCQILQNYFIDMQIDIYREREIIAFDPSPDNINRIKKINLKNVRLVNCAISSKCGNQPFFESKDRLHSGTDSLFDMNSIGYYSKNFKKVMRKTLTLDYFCSKNKIKHIRFLKIDIEGNEFHALKGSSNLLKNSAIDFIQFEFGHAARAGRIYLLDIIRLLENYNYYTYVIHPKKIKKIIYTPFVENRYNMANFVSFQNRFLPVMKKLISN
jgi:FkbM family methyltransferase